MHEHVRVRDVNMDFEICVYMLPLIQQKCFNMYLAFYKNSYAICNKPDILANL